MAIPQDFIDRLRDQANIAELVGELVQLKRVGKNLSGLCPFHAEKTPSFFVNDEDGFFHCFGCGKKGSVYDFVMESRGLSFPEAVRLVAKRVGVEIPDEEARGESEAHRQRKALVRDVLRLTAEHYHSMLLSSPAAESAREYLKGRAVSQASIQAFQIGFAPEPETLLAGVTPKMNQLYPQFVDHRSDLLALLQQSGVYSVKPNFAYETFRGRIIFPIAKSEGTCIGLGGRILVAHPQRPKYLNSSENLLYVKSRTLFGLPQAMDEIRKSREVYLVEGYMDVVAFHESGLPNAVASCGTAVTPEHVKVLKRLVDRVVVVFDGDSAGMRAAAHAFQVFLNSGIEVLGVRVPEGEDPGSLHESGRGEDLRRFVSNEREQIVDIFLAHRLEQSGLQSGLSEDGQAGTKVQTSPTPVQLGKVAKEIAKTLNRVENAVERESLQRRVVQQLGVSAEAFEDLVRRGADSQRRALPITAESDALENRGTLNPGSNREAIGAQSDFSSRVPVVYPPLGRYCFQILVAVTVEPSLARPLLEMPSVTGNALVVNTLPENVFRCLQVLAADGVQGLDSVRDRPAPEQQEVRARLRGILEMEHIDSEPILTEASRQLQVGGVQNSKLLADASQVTARLQLSSEVVTIRQQEAGINDAEEIARLAQEKLLKKRGLEKLRKSG